MNSFGNGTLQNNSSCQIPQECGCMNVVPSLWVIELITFFIGQPLVVAMLWYSFTPRKKADILNCHLALFMNVQYLLSFTHLCIVSFQQDKHMAWLMFVITYTLVGAPMSLVFICIQRYMAIIYPMHYPLLRKYRYREVAVSLVWFSSIAVAILKSGNPKAGRAELFLSVVPYLLMMSIVWMVGNGSVQMARRLRQGDRPSPAKKRAITIVRATSTVSLCCYLPAIVLSRMDHGPPDLECVIKAAQMFLLSTASVVYPLLYLCTHTHMLNCCKNHCKNNKPTSL